MPHPLPEDIDSVSGLKWFLAAVPNDPAFTRAAWDVFTELANYWKWGMEGPVPEDSDKAAQLWSTAVYETIEAYKMGFPEDLLNYIDEVEDLLRALQSVPCCDAPTVSYQGNYDPNTQSEIEDGVGDPPATYGDDPISTWAEWDEYKCEAAYFMVERAAALCEDLADIASWDTPLNAEIIGLALGRIPAVGDVFKAAWELVWQLLELSWDTIVDLETAAGEIRAAANDIACEIFNADGPDAAAAAFKTAVQDAVTQTGASLVVPWFPYTMWANIIYEGTFVNAEGTTVAIDALLTPGTNDCSCPPFTCADITALPSGWTCEPISFDGTYADLECTGGGGKSISLTTSGNYFELDTVDSGTPCHVSVRINASKPANANGMLIYFTENLTPSDVTLLGACNGIHPVVLAGETYLQSSFGNVRASLGPSVDHVGSSSLGASQPAFCVLNVNTGTIRAAGYAFWLIGT